MSASKPTTRLRFAALVVLFLLPLALRLLPLEHGGERIYVPDNSIVRSALGMARDHDLVPPVMKYSPYPNLLAYLLLPLYGVQYAAGRLGGAWQGVREFGEHLLLEPAHAAWVARALMAVLGAATAWVVFRIAREAGLRLGAWVAAWLVGTGLLSVHMSTHERPWIAVAFCMALSAWAGVRYVNVPRTSSLVWSGVCAGLAFSAHQAGLLALALPGLAWLLGGGARAGVEIQTRIGRGVLAVLCFGAVALVVGQPYLLRHGFTPPAQAVGGEAVTAQGGMTLGGMSVVFRVSTDALARTGWAALGYDPVVLLLGLAGLLLAWRVRGLRVPLLFVGVWCAMLVFNYSCHVRYFLPITAFLALPAGLVAERMWRSRGGRVALVLMLAFPLVQAARLVQVLRRDDTRAIAEARLAELPSNARVAIDRYGPDVDLDRRAIYTLATLRNTRRQTLRLREDHRKAELDRGTARRPGVNAVHLEEVFGYDDPQQPVFVFQELRGLGQTPREALRALGVTHYLRVERGGGTGDAAAIFGAEPPGRVVWRVSPERGESLPREAFLPMEMEFPLTALWTGVRAGPWLELRALDG